MQRCYACFHEYGEGFGLCPRCGRERITGAKEPIYLTPGTLIGERYLLGEVAGAGGFGIVYKAYDTKLETIVAVKEFFVSRLMTRAEGEKDVIVSRKSQEEFTYRKERFLAEARNMAKFGAHRSIPNVYEYFEENGTAYIVMELLEGAALNELLREGDRMSPDSAIKVAEEVGEALISLHQAGIIHRDVAPDNIFICEGDELRVKLMDLGAAKLADSDNEVVDIILKPGYSPAEQYDNGKNIGPWSDIYALGATLYLMLTGIKPEESTNRKISDEVIPPHDLDPEIPENISNAVMKAMAVERHLRFQKVEDFLKALRGEKKVEPLEKEKKKRARRRAFSVLAACLILAVIGFGVWRFYEEKNAEHELKEATIRVWFSVEEGSNREAAMQAVAADFTEKFPKVSVETRAIPAALYETEMLTALAAGSLPDLFYSSGLSESVLAAAADVTAVLTSDQAGECLFLDQYQSWYGTQAKQIPLGIDAPLACVITGGPVSISYPESTFSALADFGRDVKITTDPIYKALFVKALGEGAAVSTDTAGFYDQSANSPILLTGTMSLNRLREELTFYTKEFVYYDADRIPCRFVYEWSLGQGSSEQKAAAERLLSWMLGSVYQNTLMLSEASDGELPVNQVCFEEKLENRYLAPLKELYGKFSFAQ